MSHAASYGASWSASPVPPAASPYSFTAAAAVTSPMSSPALSRQSSPLHGYYNQPEANTGALVLYSANPLLQGYNPTTDPHVHGPWATGLRTNPFTPGLSPISQVPKPTYAVADPLREQYPATRVANDPLNWISDELFCLGEKKREVEQQRTPLRATSFKA